MSAITVDTHVTSGLPAAYLSQPHTGSDHTLGLTRSLIVVLFLLLSFCTLSEFQMRS